jgi:gamma-butyrobetaine dioxygenase
MARLTSLAEIQSLYAARGGLSYGESVSQIEHAVQCAALAEADGHPPSLIVAALLHDVGHLLEEEARVTGASVDGHHEDLGAEALSGLFDQAVLAPIALHVAAKRYLCFAEPAYVHGLSPASMRSLKLQGGPFDAAAAAEFQSRPHWHEAVALRRYDDTGKRAEPSMRRFGDFAPLMEQVSRREVANASLPRPTPPGRRVSPAPES